MNNLDVVLIFDTIERIQKARLKKTPSLLAWMKDRYPDFDPDEKYSNGWNTYFPRYSTDSWIIDLEKRVRLKVTEDDYCLTVELGAFTLIYHHTFGGNALYLSNKDGATDDLKYAIAQIEAVYAEDKKRKA